MNLMNVGFFTDSFLPNIDGVVSALLNYRAELVARGDKVYVFSSGTSKDKAANTDKSVFYYTAVPFPPYPAYKLALFPFSASGEAKRCKLDLVHSHAITMMGFGSIKAAKDLGVPLVGTFHTMLPLAAKTYYKKYRMAANLASDVMWRGIDVFYKPFDLVTAPTRTVAKLLESKGVENVSVVPNPVDTNRFSTKLARSPFRTILNLKPDEKLVICSGRLSFEKNMEVIVRAAKILDKQGENFRIIITGDGPSKDAVKKQVVTLGLQNRVKVIGFCEYYELPYYYRAADVFATASTFETQGLAMLEAMSCGAPVVGADSLAIPENLHDGKNGYLFAPGNSEECAEKLAKLFHLSSAKRDSMSRNAVATAALYSCKKSTDKLVDAYDEVL